MECQRGRKTKGLSENMDQTKPSSLHARHLPVLPSPAPDAGCVAACPSSTEGQEGTRSQSQHWGAVVCQKAQPRGSSTSPQDLHSNIPDPVEIKVR